MELPTVLLISDDAEFSSAVPARWLREARVPAFTLMTGDLCQSFDPEIFDIAIVGELQPESLSRVVKLLEASANPVIFARNFDLDASSLPSQAIVIPPGETAARHFGFGRPRRYCSAVKRWSSHGALRKRMRPQNAKPPLDDTCWRCAMG